MVFLNPVLSVSTALIVSVILASDTDGEPVRRIGSNKQLLLDDYIVESLDRAERKLNQPNKHAANPLISMVPAGEPGRDTEMMPSGLSSAIYHNEEKLFKL